MLMLKIPSQIQIKLGKNCILVENQSKQKISWKKKWENTLIFYQPKTHKLYLLNTNLQKGSLFLNLKRVLKGLTIGFFFKLQLIGVGYKIRIENSLLYLKIGYSHEVIFSLPEGVSLVQPKPRVPIYILTGPSMLQLTQLAAQIRFLKRPDPYKGKGFRYYNEVLFYKQGKKTGM